MVEANTAASAVLAAQAARLHELVSAFRLPVTAGVSDAVEAQQGRILRITGHGR
jgi:methyl-accepting chemotaxis protein